MGGYAAAYAESKPDASDSSAFPSSFLSIAPGISPRIRHTYEFTGLDSVRLSLMEFSETWMAYAAFQYSAGPMGMAEGFHRVPGALIFPHGHFLATLESPQAGMAPAAFLRENLVFLGEDLFSKPEEFSAFPLLGRIPHGERVISRDFLGRTWQGPVFTVAYRCHTDTATAFRAWTQNSDSVKSWLTAWKGKTDTLNWGRDLHFQGQDEFHRPLIFWFFPEGVMGFAGCYDPNLAAEYAKKMEKTASFWKKP
jgi:hypothetical protein